MSTVTVKPIPRRKARAKRRINVPEAISKRAVSFVAILGMTYLASSLSGQVMVEKARQEAIRASQKALDAKKVESELSKRLDQMTGFNAIGQWAETHNFKSIEELAALKAGIGSPSGARVASDKIAQATPERKLFKTSSPSPNPTFASSAPGSSLSNSVGTAFMPASSVIQGSEPAGARHRESQDGSTDASGSRVGKGRHKRPRKRRSPLVTTAEGQDGASR